MSFHKRKTFVQQKTKAPCTFSSIHAISFTQTCSSQYLHLPEPNSPLFCFSNSTEVFPPLYLSTSLRYTISVFLLCIYFLSHACTTFEVHLSSLLTTIISVLNPSLILSFLSYSTFITYLKSKRFIPTCLHWRPHSVDVHPCFILTHLPKLNHTLL